MLQYKKVKIPKKNLPKSICSKKFKTEWIKALSKGSDLSDFLKLIKPFIKKITYQIKSLDSFDYFLNTLLRYIDTNPDIALKKIKKWSFYSDVESEIYFIIISRLRSLKKVPFNAKPLMAEYYFVLDLKYALSKVIKKTNLKKIKYIQYKKTNNILLKTNNQWYNYLLMLYYQGYSVTEISKITRLSRKTIINEGEKIWECLKQTQ